MPSSPTRSRLRRLPSRLSRRLRTRLVALGLVGAAMVGLPLSQLLHRQQDELDRLSARRAVLDPIARAVDTERSLLLHRDAASRMLRGRPDLETERRVRQGEVDDRLMALAIALDIGPSERAVQESDALRGDWSLLARRLLARSLSADDSDQGHRLLVEQTLQIVDLLDQARPAAGARTRPTLATLQAEGTALDQRRDRIRAERRDLAVGLLALAIAALWLVRPLWPRTARPGAAPADDGLPTRPAQSEETGRLLARLRRGDAPPSEQPPDSRLDDLRQR